jgi:hypothetical protein
MAIDAVSPRKTIEDEEAEQRTGLLDQELGVVDYRSIASSGEFIVFSVQWVVLEASPAHPPATAKLVGLLDRFRLEPRC